MKASDIVNDLLENDSEEFPEHYFNELGDVEKVCANFGLVKGTSLVASNWHKIMHLPSGNEVVVSVWADDRQTGVPPNFNNLLHYDIFVASASQKVYRMGRLRHHTVAVEQIRRILTDIMQAIAQAPSPDVLSKLLHDLAYRHAYRIE